MSLANLIYSAWKNDNNPINKNDSLFVNQGQQYKKYKSDKIHLLENQQLMNNNHSLIEGFTGMLGSTQVNIKNKNDENEYNSLENTFNQRLSDYAIAQKNLMDKTQKYIQSTGRNDKRNINIYTTQAQNSSDIHPKWKGCYASGKGLLYQDDMGNSATLSSCKTRASDLGYSNFAITGTGKCYVGNTTNQNNDLSYKSMVSYTFSQNKNANMGGLLKNGQIGTFKDYTESNLVTDLLPVNGCDAELGGLINGKKIVASYGMNCNAPPQKPSNIITHLDKTGKHMTWDSSADYAKSKGGRLATFNEILDYINKKDGVALVPNEDQWVAVTDGYDGATRDWIQIGNPGYHFPGKSHIQYYGYPPWGDTLSDTAPYNVYTFWISTEPTEIDCSIYKDNDTKLPHKCIQELWNNSGCLTDSGFNEKYWISYTKKNMINDMHNWATMTDDNHRTKCYGTDKSKWPTK